MSGIEDRGQISDVLTSCKIRGGVKENAKRDDRDNTTAKPVIMHLIGCCCAV